MGYKGLLARVEEDSFVCTALAARRLCPVNGTTQDQQTSQVSSRRSWLCYLQEGLRSSVVPVSPFGKELLIKAEHLR